jgi:DNA invertase Pin-like site-specific DNA recombinase
MTRRKVTAPGQSPPSRAVGYVRISKDRPDETSTETQEQRIRAYCTAQGWRVVEVVTEPGRSAFKSSRATRPGLARVRGLVAAGAADVLVCWKLDRVARNAIDLLTIVRDLEDDGGRFCSVTESFDTSAPVGRAMLTMLAALAELESAQKSERLATWHEDRVTRGRTPTGPRPFGYRRERNELHVVEAEALVIRDAAARVVAGDSLRQIVRDLNAAGVVGKLDRPFNRRGLVSILCSPTIAACRETSPGVFVPSDQWDAILDLGTWRQVRDVLTDPVRRKGTTNQRRWLLTGIAACSRCVDEEGEPVKLFCKPHAAGPRYSCPSCHLSIEAARTDDIVQQDLLAMLNVKAWRRLRRASVVRSSDVAAFEQARSELLARFDAHDIDGLELGELLEGLRRQQHVVSTPSPALPAVDDLRQSWAGLDLEQKRLVLSAATESLTIKPWTPSASFDDSRIVWVPVA